MRAVTVLALVSIQASDAANPWKSLLSEASQLAYRRLPKDMLQEAGFPTAGELVCEALNSTNLQNRFANGLCALVPPKVAEHDTAKACHAAVAFAWKQEQAEEKCPGAPEPWWPFHMLHVMANKLICFELNKGRFHDKEKDITADVCKELAHNKLRLWACEAAMREIWDNYKKDCHGSTLSALEELVPQADDIHV